MTAAPYTGGKGLRAALTNVRAFSADPITFYQDLSRTADGGYRGAVLFDLFGPNLLVNDPDAAGRVLTGQVGTDPFTKDGARFFAVLRRILADGLFTAEGTAHLHRRRLVAPALSPRPVAAAQPGIVAACDRLAQRWRAAAGTVVDVQVEARRLAVDVLAETLTGPDLRAEAEEFAVLDERLEEALLAVLNAPVVLPDRVPTAGNRRLRGVRRDLDALAGRIIAHRRAVDGSPALLAELVREFPAGDGDAQLVDEVATLLTGGYKSTASALTWTFYLLARHPEVFAVVRADGGGAYTRAVVAESLRLYPPAWSITRMAREPVELAGIRVPRGTVVTVSPPTLHRNPAVWPDPDRFDPGRWTGGPPAHPHAYLPFGAGRHRCVGNHLALSVLVTALARITPQVGFDAPAGPVRQGTRAFSYAPDGIPLRLTA